MSGRLKYSEEELNQKGFELEQVFAFNPNIQPFPVASNTQYENRYWGLNVFVVYKKQTQMCKCTGVYIDAGIDKKLAKYPVHIVDLTRVDGVWRRNKGVIEFDYEVLCIIGEVEKEGFKYKALQCLPA